MIDSAGDIHTTEAPSKVLEERLSEVADTVLAEQFSAQSGDELLAPDVGEDTALRKKPVI
jgi:hypothetical protein